MIRGTTRSTPRRLSWASITPFGVPVVPEVKISSTSSSGAGRGQAADLRLPVGRERRVVVGRFGRERLDGRRREVAEADLARVRARRGRSRGSGGAAPDAATIALDRVRRHPQVERDEDEPRAHRAEVRGRQLRRRRRPGEDPVAGLRPSARSRQAASRAPPVELAVGPVVGRPSSCRRPSAGRSPNRARRVVEQVEQRRHRRRS